MNYICLKMKIYINLKKELNFIYKLLYFSIKIQIYMHIKSFFTKQNY